MVLYGFATIVKYPVNGIQKYILIEIIKVRSDQLSLLQNFRYKLLLEDLRIQLNSDSNSITPF